MNIKTISALNSAEAKILLYLSYKTSITLGGTKRTILEANIFQVFDSLEKKGLISFHLDEEYHELYLIFNSLKYNLEINKWDELDLIDSLTYLFYEQDSQEYFIEEILKKNNLWTPLLERKFKKARRSETSNIVGDIRGEIVSYFALVLKEKLSYILQPSDLKLNFYQAKYLQKNYPDLTFSDFKEAIDFFIGDKFWRDVILSISALNKHLPKFLVKHRSYSEDKIKLL